MGFCILNNVAVAARHLQKCGLAKRILILDWDIHHGNGTQKIFLSDPTVLFISLHRHDHGRFYPHGVEGSSSFVGEEPAMGFSVNVAWNGPGITDADYLAAFLRVVLPIAMDFQPDFVLVSAGFDAAEGDPIGQCKVTPRGFALMTHLLTTLANGKILLVLEGGYNIPGIAACAEACMRVLLGEPVATLPPSPDLAVLTETSSSALHSIEATVRAQSKYWSARTSLLLPRHYPLPTPDDQHPGLVSLQRTASPLPSLPPPRRCHRRVLGTLVSEEL